MWTVWYNLRTMIPQFAFNPERRGGLVKTVVGARSLVRTCVGILVGSDFSKRSREVLSLTLFQESE